MVVRPRSSTWELPKAVCPPSTTIMLPAAVCPLQKFSKLIAGMCPLPTIVALLTDGVSNLNGNCSAPSGRTSPFSDLTALGTTAMVGGTVRHAFNN